MWITTITIDLVAVRNLTEEEQHTVLLSIRDKKNELRQDPTVGGEGVLPFGPVDNLADLPPDQTTLVIKRQWTSETVAREFATFADAAADFITATVEEQV